MRREKSIPSKCERNQQGVEGGIITLPERESLHQGTYDPFRQRPRPSQIAFQPTSYWRNVMLNYPRTRQMRITKTARQEEENSPPENKKTRPLSQQTRPARNTNTISHLSAEGFSRTSCFAFFAIRILLSSAGLLHVRWFYPPDGRLCQQVAQRTIPVDHIEGRYLPSTW